MQHHSYRAKDPASALDLVERRLGPEAFILSLDWDGDEVVVLASDKALDAAGHPVNGNARPALRHAQAVPKDDEGHLPSAPRRPRFLDPSVPKPFAGATQRDAPAPPPVPGRQRQTPDMGPPSPPRATPPSRHIILITQSKSDLFGFCIKYADLLPQDRLVSWEADAPWPLDTEPNAHPDGNIVLVASRPADIADKMAEATKRAPDARIHVVPLGLEGNAMVSLLEDLKHVNARPKGAQNRQLRIGHPSPEPAESDHATDARQAKTLSFSSSRSGVVFKSARATNDLPGTPAAPTFASVRSPRARWDAD